ncbi:replication-relaxation family protein [Amycolatopsis rifamycinica]|uniref:Replication-relaxation n=1 Tax=Amycolatopsis rifamycinica TaxID=287986 RepID=A0A066U6P5_9PSEU|nr:replication-relaxation family protein [Amycolatopsis rifamycinica]KDN23131.1 hypothetical protein DV20_05280 [Amycolatopsis rifamycinica]
MELSARDLEVLKLVGMFGQLASTHLVELVFADRSHSVPDTVLGRLVRKKFLSRVGRRASSDKGGAGAYVYQLGRFGRSLLGVEGRASPVVNNHALMIADTYAALRRAEKAQLLVLREWAVELPLPPVRADLFVAVDYPAQRRSSSYYLEIDLGTERPVRLMEKLDGYRRVYEASTAEYFPYVAFVVQQAARKSEIERIIRRHPGSELFRVFLLTELLDELAVL